MSTQTDRIIHLQGTNPSGPGSSQYLVTGIVVATRAPHALQVRLNIDRLVSEADLPWAYPLLPPGMLPIVGELVNVFVPDPSRPLHERYWVGPVFTDWEYMRSQRFAGKQFTLSLDSWTQQAGGPRSLRGDDSRYPHFSHAGRVHHPTRGNTDAIYDQDSAYLRSARHEWSDKSKPNQENPGLVGLSQDTRSKQSNALVRAETIALLTKPIAAKDKLNPSFEEVKVAKAEAHPLAFADITASYLEIFRRALVEHLHPGPGKAPVTGDALRELLALDFNLLGSENLVGN